MLQTPSAPVISERPTNAAVARTLLVLALPVLFEQILNMLVGLNDTYLANHLPKNAADAGAAVGTMAYLLWFVGLLVTWIGAGSTAIISRARGARHQSLANRVTGQSISAAIVLGFLTAGILLLAAHQIVAATQLRGQASNFALTYLRLLCISLPPTTVMLMGSACLRGGGDTLTPALVMVLVDIINMLASFALCRGWWGLPIYGFNGIAAGTVIAYFAGGLVQFLALWIGTRGAKLHLHRMRLQWQTLKRMLRIGIPAGTESMLDFAANFSVIAVINRMDATNAMASAHMNTIRLESLSFLWGIVFCIAASTMVGNSLGRRDPALARRYAYLAYAIGGGVMTFCGLLMMTIGHYPAAWLSPDNAHIVHLTTQCLFVAGFTQSGFAAAVIFSAALRGAGDTFAVMALNLTSIFILRFAGVLVVGLWLHLGLVAVWIVLSCELFLRGGLMFVRFANGTWEKIEV